MSIERVVGGSAQERTRGLASLKEKLRSQNTIEGLSNIEKEKSPETIQCIRIVDEITSEILEEYGINAEHTSPENVHIIKKEFWTDDSARTEAFFALAHQGIFVLEGIPEEEKLVMVFYLLHEMFHFKSYQAAQILDDGKLEQYRVGLGVEKRDGSTLLFDALNEAVTDELTRQAIADPVFSELLSEELDAYKRTYLKASAEKHLPADPDINMIDMLLQQVPHPKERAAFNMLVDKLFERNEGTYNTRDDVYALFIKSAYTGDLLTIGRLIDHTFGVGTLRKIAESDAEVFADVVASL